MVEEGIWLVYPETGVAHYVIRWSSDSLFDTRLSCNKHRKADSSWSSMKGHEEKCKTCLDIIETEHLSGIERFEEINKRRIERAKNSRKER